MGTKMLRKVESSRLREAFSYVFGGDPRDAWEFHVGKTRFRFINGWRSGAALLVGDVEVARSDKLISVRGKEPMVSAEVRDDAGKPMRVDVYVRAIASVTIHVRVNGVPISEGFL